LVYTAHHNIHLWLTFSSSTTSRHFTFEIACPTKWQITSDEKENTDYPFSLTFARSNKLHPCVRGRNLNRLVLSGRVHIPFPKPPAAVALSAVSRPARCASRPAVRSAPLASLASRAWPLVVPRRLPRGGWPGLTAPVSLWAGPTSRTAAAAAAAARMMLLRTGPLWGGPLRRSGPAPRTAAAAAAAAAAGGPALGRLRALRRDAIVLSSPTSPTSPSALARLATLAPLRRFSRGTVQIGLDDGDELPSGGEGGTERGVERR